MTPEEKAKIRERIDQEQCIYCGAGRNDLSFENVEIDGEQAFQSVSCVKCERNFTEVYRFIGVLDDQGTEILSK